MKIYAGNLTYDVTEEQLQEEFATFGEVVSVSIPTDKYTGKPRGFAYPLASPADGFGSPVAGRGVFHPRGEPTTTRE